jgi:hypothetical protein
LSAAKPRKPNRRPDIIIDERPAAVKARRAPKITTKPNVKRRKNAPVTAPEPTAAAVPAPQPVTVDDTRPTRDPALVNMTNEQVFCRAFMHAWFLMRSEEAPFVIGGAKQVRLFFVCAHGCGGLKRATHDERTGKRWAVSRSMPESNKVGRLKQDVFEQECWARGLIEAFAEHGRAVATGKVAALPATAAAAPGAPTFSG